MFIKALKSKIHATIVTATRLNYLGSLAVDSELMAAAGILPYEAVLMADITNGSRAETYIIPAEAGSGKVEVLGAAARLINPGDTIIILNFGYYTPQEAKKLKPKVVLVDKNNKIKKLL